jgi:hypothetical protein
METGYLLLKRASGSRPSGEWNDDDYDVVADDFVVGRIFQAHAAPDATGFRPCPVCGRQRATVAPCSANLSQMALPSQFEHQNLQSKRAWGCNQPPPLLLSPAPRSRQAGLFRGLHSPAASSLRRLPSRPRVSRHSRALACGLCDIRCRASTSMLSRLALPRLA